MLRSFELGNTASLSLLAKVSFAKRFVGAHFIPFFSS